MRYVIGVDVGTGSATAGIFDQTGFMSDAQEPVLLGAAIAALSQFETKDAVSIVTPRMSKTARIRQPDPLMEKIHAVRYQSFCSIIKRPAFCKAIIDCLFFTTSHLKQVFCPISLLAATFKSSFI